MAETVNILGETQKEQWLNAINIYSMVVESNMVAAKFELPSDGDAYHGLCVASNTLKDFADEMRRLVEGVFDD